MRQVRLEQVVHVDEGSYGAGDGICQARP
jgi:hypothetical protein